MNRDDFVNALALGCVTALTIAALLVLKGDAKDMVLAVGSGLIGYLSKGKTGA